MISCLARTSVTLFPALFELFWQREVALGQKSAG
jgi:hypothetical protein